jgi:hypothetical protein
MGAASALSLDVLSSLLAEEVPSSPSPHEGGAEAAAAGAQVTLLFIVGCCLLGIGRGLVTREVYTKR